jgi:hypothetical protein
MVGAICCRPAFSLISLTCSLNQQRKHWCRSIGYQLPAEFLSKAQVSLILMTNLAKSTQTTISQYPCTIFASPHLFALNWLALSFGVSRAPQEPGRGDLLLVSLSVISLTFFAKSATKAQASLSSLSSPLQQPATFFDLLFRVIRAVCHFGASVWHDP